MFDLIVMNLPPLETATHQKQSIQIVKKAPDYRIEMNGRHYPCYLGKNGIATQKKEGDGKTPAGDFGLKKVFFRSDRIHPAQLHTKLPIQAISPDDGWCDEPNHPQYNQPVKLPFPKSHEKMWLSENYYDLVLVTDYNMDPAQPGKGSAIFVHIKDKDTHGCLGLTKQDLLDIINQADQNTRLSISPTGEIRFYQRNVK